MSKYITKQTIWRVKDAIDIVEHIGSQVPLSGSGDYLYGPSPFCERSGPRDLQVDGRIQKFTCSKEGLRGDVIDFEIALNGITLVEAVELLALQYGIYVEYGRRPGSDRFARARVRELRQQY